MSADKDTVAFYQGAAAQYAGKFAKTEPDAALSAFMDAVKPGGRVLDLGCGPGNAAAMMRDAGLVAEASDASQAMADLALENHGIVVRVEDFDGLTAQSRYDGIWANFCLLHAPRSAMPRHLAAIHDALVPGGVLHLGLKLGTGERRDRLNRFYTFYAKDELLGLLATAGFEVTATRQGKEAGMAGTVDPFIIVLARA